MLRDDPSHAIHENGIRIYRICREAYAGMGTGNSVRTRKILTSTMLDEKDFTCQGASLTVFLILKSGRSLALPVTSRAGLDGPAM